MGGAALPALDPSPNAAVGGPPGPARRPHRPVGAPAATEAAALAALSERFLHRLAVGAPPTAPPLGTLPTERERALRCDAWRRSLPPYPLGGGAGPEREIECRGRA